MFCILFDFQIEHKNVLSKKKNFQTSVSLVTIKKETNYFLNTNETYSDYETTRVCAFDPDFNEMLDVEESNYDLITVKNINMTHSSILWTSPEILDR